MKVQPTTRNVNSNGIQNSVSFGIKEGGFAHIFNVLRNQLYSNKYSAVLREYSTNAVDAHVEAGIPERPIEVSLPSAMNPSLKIRDFGPALTDKEIQEIYAFYGESTKRNTNQQTGMLGIGSKSAFAYGDNFVINSYVDGKKCVYNAFIDPSQLGQIAKLSEEPSDEESGIEIVIPVKEKDVEVFRETAQEIFQHFKVRPIVKGQALKFDDRETLFESEDWEWRKNSNEHTGYYSRNGYGDAIAVMGNIGYPIEWNSLNYDGEGYTELQNLCSDNLIIKLEIGDLEISASREKLQYTDHTINSIISKLKRVKKELVQEISKQFDDCDTLFDAKCLIGEIDDMASGLYQFRELIGDSVKVNGKKVGDDSFRFSKIKTEEASVRHLKVPYSARTSKLKLCESNQINCKRNTVVVHNDENASRGLLNRILALAVEEKKDVYLLEIGKGGAKALKKEAGFDAPLTKFSELPKRKLNEFEGYGRVASVKGEWSTPKDEKSYSKVFSLDWKSTGSWQHKQSDHWTKESVDFDSEEGVYVLIDRYQVVIDGKDAPYHGFQDVRHWSQMKSTLENLDIELPKVVGVKKASSALVEGNENWTPFFTWIKSKLKARVEELNLAQHFANFEARDHLDERWIVKSDNQILKRLKKELVDKDSPMLALYKAREEMQTSVPKKVDLSSLQKLATELDMKLYGKKVKATHDLSKMVKDVKARYAMIQHTEGCLWSWRIDDEFITNLVNYINVIDVCNAKNS